MSNPIPNRSARGCLTCKQRKKKCDETKPVCERCASGNFECLGYARLDSAKASTPKRWHTSVPQIGTAQVQSLVSDSASSAQLSPDLGFSLDSSILSFDNNHIWAQEQHCALAVTQLREAPNSIPRSLELDPFELNNMVELIVSQYGRLAHRVAFRPFPFSIENALAQRAQSSNLIRWSMYLGARIAQALLDDTNWESYVSWIENFHHRIAGTQSVVKVDPADLDDRLTVLQDLAFYAYMILNSSAGYALFRKCVPLFLQLAAKFPQLWTGNSAISIHHALHAPRPQIIKFVFADTISALAFGTIPLLHYDTAIHTADHELSKQPFVEWVYACPVIMVILFAKINSSRISRLSDQTVAAPQDAREIEEHLQKWSPTIDHVDQPSTRIARLAIQECWRQAVLIYLYLGLCGADSADERVEPLVRQVAQLASMVETGSPLEIHLFIPCLIAGAAARKEKHRTIIRKKIKVSQKTDACMLRGADFVLVLDHLWHGAAAGGRPTFWEDYVNSRCATLPVEF